MKTRHIHFLFLFSFLALAANFEGRAATYELKTITPAVQQALDGRQARYGAIQELKAAGRLGENQSGYVAVLDGSSEAASLAEAENADRRAIYHAIAEQNNLGASGLGIVEGVFAEVQRERARSGERVQLGTGEWITKA